MEELKLNQNFREETKGILRNIVASDPQLVRSFRGHEGGINAVSFDPNMKQIGSASDDGIVYIWSFKPQQRPYKFLGHKGAVYDVQFSHDGKYIATGGEDRQIRLWENSVQNKCRVISGHCGAVKNIHFSNNSELLLSSSADKTLKLWRISNFPQKIAKHREGSLSKSPDHKNSSQNKKASQKDKTQNKVKKDHNKPQFEFSLSGHKNWVLAGQFSPDNRIIVSGSDDKTVKLWDFTQHQIIHTYDYHQGGVNTVKFSPDGTCVASGSKDSSINIFDTRSHKLIQHYEVTKKNQSVNQVAFHPSGQYLSSASSDNIVKIWDLRQGKLAWTLHSHEKEANCVAFNSGGDYFVTGGEDRLVMIWKTNFDEEIDENIQKQVTSFQNQQGKQYSTGGLTLQTLYKSNKAQKENEKQFTNQNRSISPQKNNQSSLDQNKENQSQTFGNNQQNILSEKLAGPLEKIVNQLDIVSESVKQLDLRLSRNEHGVKKLMETRLVQDILQNQDQQQQHLQQQQQGNLLETFNQFNSFQQSIGTIQSQTENIFSKGALANSQTLQSNFLQQQ